MYDQPEATAGEYVSVVAPPPQERAAEAAPAPPPPAPRTAANKPKLTPHETLMVFRELANQAVTELCKHDTNPSTLWSNKARKAMPTTFADIALRAPQIEPPYLPAYNPANPSPTNRLAVSHIEMDLDCQQCELIQLIVQVAKKTIKSPIYSVQFVKAIGGSSIAQCIIDFGPSITAARLMIIELARYLPEKCSLIAPSSFISGGDPQTTFYIRDFLIDNMVEEMITAKQREMGGGVDRATAAEHVVLTGVAATACSLRSTAAANSGGGGSNTSSDIGVTAKDIIPLVNGPTIVAGHMWAKQGTPHGVATAALFDKIASATHVDLHPAEDGVLYATVLRPEMVWQWFWTFPELALHFQSQLLFKFGILFCVALCDAAYGTGPSDSANNNASASSAPTVDESSAAAATAAVTTVDANAANSSSLGQGQQRTDEAEDADDPLASIFVKEVQIQHYEADREQYLAAATSLLSAPPGYSTTATSHRYTNHYQQQRQEQEDEAAAASFAALLQSSAVTAAKPGAADGFTGASIAAGVTTAAPSADAFLPSVADDDDDVYPPAEAVQPAPIKVAVSTTSAVPATGGFNMNRNLEYGILSVPSSSFAAAGGVPSITTALAAAASSSGFALPASYSGFNAPVITSTVAAPAPVFAGVGFTAPISESHKTVTVAGSTAVNAPITGLQALSMAVHLGGSGGGVKLLNKPVTTAPAAADDEDEEKKDNSKNAVLPTPTTNTTAPPPPPPALPSLQAQQGFRIIMPAAKRPRDDNNTINNGSTNNGVTELIGEGGVKITIGSHQQQQHHHNSNPPPQYSNINHATVGGPADNSLSNNNSNGILGSTPHNAAGGNSILGSVDGLLPPLFGAPTPMPHLISGGGVGGPSLLPPVLGAPPLPFAGMTFNNGSSGFMAGGAGPSPALVVPPPPHPMLAATPPMERINMKKHAFEFLMEKDIFVSPKYKQTNYYCNFDWTERDVLRIMQAAPKLRWWIDVAASPIQYKCIAKYGTSITSIHKITPCLAIVVNGGTFGPAGGTATPTTAMTTGGAGGKAQQGAAATAAASEASTSEGNARLVDVIKAVAARRLLSETPIWWKNTEDAHVATLNKKAEGEKEKAEGAATEGSSSPPPPSFDLVSSTTVFESAPYPSHGSPIPPITALPIAEWNGILAHSKVTEHQSLSHGLYYFRFTPKDTPSKEKTSYKHPILKREFIVTPQSFLFDAIAKAQQEEKLGEVPLGCFMPRICATLKSCQQNGTATTKPLVEIARLLIERHYADLLRLLICALRYYYIKQWYDQRSVAIQRGQLRPHEHPTYSKTDDWIVSLIELASNLSAYAPPAPSRTLGPMPCLMDVVLWLIDQNYRVECLDELVEGLLKIKYPNSLVA